MSFGVLENAQTHLVAVFNVGSGHPSLRTACVYVRFRFRSQGWIQVYPTDGASHKTGAVLHLPRTQWFNCGNDCTTSILS